MFDIGFWEIVLIGVVGLVVIGPERLPEVARTLGIWVSRTRRFINQVKTDVSAELKQEELRKAIENNVGLDEIKQIMNTDEFTLEDEDYSEPDYQVKAIDDEPSDTDTKTPTNKTTASTKDKNAEPEARAIDDEPAPAKAKTSATKTTETSVDHEPKA